VDDPQLHTRVTQAKVAAAAANPALRCAPEAVVVHAGTGFHDKVEVSSLSDLPGLWPTFKHLFVVSLGTESVKPCVESEHTTFVDVVSQVWPATGVTVQAKAEVVEIAAPSVQVNFAFVGTVIDHCQAAW